MSGEVVLRMSFELAGAHHRLEDFQKAQVQMGDKLKFWPEPENQFDKHAIRVVKVLGQDIIVLGYVPRGVNEQMLKLMAVSSGEVVVTSAWEMGCSVAVEFANKDK